MGIGICPCKDCTTETGRSSSCHSNCKKYIKWRREMDTRNAIRRECIDKETDIINYKKRFKKK